MTSLNAQIRDAERQLLKRRQTISIGKDKLMSDIHQQMTAPASLILAGSVGFISGELSRCPTAKLADNSHRPLVVGAQDVKTAFSLIFSAYTLYNTLPVVWLRNYFQPPKKSGNMDAA